MNRRILAACFLVAALAGYGLFLPGGTGLALAQGVYQWLDEEGRVVFGDAPPPDADVRAVPLLPGPTPDAVEAARERAAAMQQLADEFATERRRREAEAAAIAAEAWRQSLADSWGRPPPEYYPWPPYPRRHGVWRPHPGYPGPGKPDYPPIRPPEPPAGIWPPQWPREASRPPRWPMVQSWSTPELGR